MRSAIEIVSVFVLITALLLITAHANRRAFLVRHEKYKQCVASGERPIMCSFKTYFEES